jgi:hypothetical protein
MTTSKSSGSSASTQNNRQSQGSASISSRASEALQSGVERVKSNPGMTAAIVGGVAAAAAATVYRDKISETIGGLRSNRNSNDGSASQTH